MSSAPPEVAAKPKKLGLLSRARKLPEQPFEITCLCGQTLSGLRLEQAQKIRCSHCDRAHFILPLNRYPPPRRAKRKKAKPEEPLPERLRKLVTPLLLTGQRIGQRLLRGVQTRVKASALAVWQALTPIRLTLAALTLVLLAGGVYGVQRQRYAQAVQTLRSASQAAETALEQQDWPAATLALAECAEAVQRIGRDDSFARELVQKHREMQAISGLCSLPMEDLILEATGQKQLSGPWEQTFGAIVKGKWLVLECTLQPGEQATGEPVALLPVSLPIAGERVNIHWPISLISAASGQTSNYLCAGQIARIEPTQLPGQTLVITMQPESAFLWCNEQTCVPLGLELHPPGLPEHSLQTVLSRQRELLLGADP